MSTTIRELLACTTRTIERTPPNPNLPFAAVAVLRHCARALRELSYEGPSGLGARQMHEAVTELIDACNVAADTWPGGNGRAESLAGVAADAIARLSGPLAPAGRWALAVAVANTARHCAERAQAFPPSHAVPQLVAVYSAAVGVRQVAALYPPTPGGRIALDHAIPSVELLSDEVGLAAAAAAAPALAAAVRAQVARGVLTVAEMLACARASEIATSYAAAVAHAIEPLDERERMWAAAPAGWRAVYGSCAAFDDGTKQRPAQVSGVIVWATRLEAELHRDLSRVRSGGERDLPQTATAMRTVVNALPGVGQDLERAVWQWSASRYLLAPAHRLFSQEDGESDVAVAIHRVAFARGHDLDVLQRAVSDACALSASLAADLDGSRAVVGRQNQPALAAKHVAAARSAGQSELRDRARRAQGLASATTGSPGWSFGRQGVCNGHGTTGVTSELRQPPTPETINLTRDPRVTSADRRADTTLASELALDTRRDVGRPSGDVDDAGPISDPEWDRLLGWDML